MFTYEVQTGENLPIIAKRYGISVEEILTINEIHDIERIPAREVIRIPLDMIPPTVPSPRPCHTHAMRQIGDLLYVFYTDRFRYRRNQNVQLTLIKVNISQRQVDLTYNTSQRYDFYVRGGRNRPILWQWSNDRSFSQVMERITLQPGQSQIFRATWNQRTNRGTLVDTGVYTVQAENVAVELQGERISNCIRIV